MRARLIVAATVLCSACSATTDPSSSQVYTGTYSVQVVESTVTTSLLGGGTFPCTNTYTMSGTLSMTIAKSAASGGTLGTASIVGTQKEIGHSNGASCVAKTDLSTGWEPTLTGTLSDLHFSGQTIATNGAYIVTTNTSFAGALAGGVVTGALTFGVNGAGTIGTGTITQTYSVTTSVTLR